MRDAVLRSESHPDPALSLSFYNEGQAFFRGFIINMWDMSSVLGLEKSFNLCYAFHS